MSPNQTLLSIEEYLHTSYRPDCDYVDGQVLERNMGEKPHARLQGFFVKLLGRYEEDFGFEVLPELRLQTKETRFSYSRCDGSSCLESGYPIIKTPPMLCIEILSSEDRMGAIREKVGEYAEYERGDVLGRRSLAPDCSDGGSRRRSSGIQRYLYSAGHAHIR